MAKYLLVEIAIEDDGSEFETPAQALMRRVPRITYLGEFDHIEDALAAKIHAGRDNPGMAYAFHILAVIQ